MDNKKTYTEITDDQLYAIAEETVGLLRKRSFRISFSESCTGGLCAATLVSVPDASWVFDSSVVTYSNESKMHYLGVRSESIAEHGVVSEEVAREMAVGTAAGNNAQVAVSVTGIAGPGGATAAKPVGMVCFGFYINGNVYTNTVQFGNIGRNAVRAASVKYVYTELHRLLTQAN